MRRPELCFQRRYELQIRCTAAQLMRVDGARKVRRVQTRGGHVPNGNNRGARGIVAATRQTPKWGASRYRIRHRHAPGEPYHKCNVQTGTQSTVRSLVDSAKTSVALPAALPALALEPLIDLGQPGLAYPGEITDAGLRLAHVLAPVRRNMGRGERVEFVDEPQVRGGVQKTRHETRAECRLEHRSDLVPMRDGKIERQLRMAACSRIDHVRDQRRQRLAGKGQVEGLLYQCTVVRCGQQIVELLPLDLGFSGLGHAV